MLAADLSRLRTIDGYFCPIPRPQRLRASVCRSADAYAYRKWRQTVSNVAATPPEHETQSFHFRMAWCWGFCYSHSGGGIESTPSTCGKKLLDLSINSWHISHRRPISRARPPASSHNELPLISSVAILRTSRHTSHGPFGSS